ncbi:MAG: TssN family type VI secretion system protein [Mariniphaga sp.]|nr:TssN family type VI secretion system protein [Mariniphaga sp.]
MENQGFIIFFLVLAMVLLGLVLKSKNAKQFKFKVILYVLVYGILIGTGGFLGNKSVFSVSNSIIFYILFAWFLVLGIFHVVLFNKILPWSIDKKFWKELSLTFAIGFLGAATLLIVFHFFNYSAYAKTFLSSVLIFFVPYMFFSTFLFYLDIPVKVLRKWHYPVDSHIDDPTDREMDSPFVIGFEFKKKADDENMTSFRAKAPKEMIFGKLFYYFINDYNDRNPGEKIDYMEDNNKPVSWIFYHKPKWYSRFRYIDPKETNSFNFIRENSVIVCKRVIEK